jgi:hypothetical protein
MVEDFSDAAAQVNAIGTNRNNMGTRGYSFS